MDAAEVDPVSIDEIVSLADRMLADRDRVVAELDEELERVHARYTLLQAMRAAIEPYAEDVAEPSATDELPLAEATEKVTVAGTVEDAISLALQIQGRPMSAKELAERVGAHHTKIGRIVSASPGLFVRVRTPEGNMIKLAS